uniref:Heparan sulfate 2-O-sulfotransferase pipe n=1 Tax=Stomoxys calcitrans TaxID=35570 RepID=A0A1I8NXT4_STOCA
RLPKEGAGEIPKADFLQLQKPQNRNWNQNRNRNFNQVRRNRNRRHRNLGGKRLKPVFGGKNNNEQGANNKTPRNHGGPGRNSHMRYHKHDDDDDEYDEYDEDEYYDDEEDENEDENDDEDKDKDKTEHETPDKTNAQEDKEKKLESEDDKDKTKTKKDGHDKEENKDEVGLKKDINSKNHNKNESGEDDEYDDDDYDSLYSADALNNTKKAQVELVFFNRVPKVGSQSLMELMARLGNVHNFLHSRDQGKAHETIFLKPPQQKAFLKELYSKSRPRVYSQHIAYINFTHHHQPRPIYINLVRDPIERIRSWHYYVRAEWYYKDLQAKLGDKAPKMPPKEFMEMDLDTCVKTGDIHCQFNQMEIKNPAGDHRRQTLFFCGQNRQLCMPFNSRAAMQKAKRTVEEEYAVVGTWEDTNITLSVLEHYIPRFFGNAKTIYYEGKDRLGSVNKNNVTRPISEETRMILSKNLTHEIEFYEFCKQRLYLQYNAITDGKSLDNDDYLLIPDSSEDSEEENQFKK